MHLPVSKLVIERSEVILASAKTRRWEFVVLCSRYRLILDVSDFIFFVRNFAHNARLRLYFIVFADP